VLYQLSYSRHKGKEARYRRPVFRVKHAKEWTDRPFQSYRRLEHY